MKITLKSIPTIIVNTLVTRLFNKDISLSSIYNLITNLPLDKLKRGRRRLG